MENGSLASAAVGIVGATTLRIPLRHLELHGVSVGSGPLALLFHGISANAYVFLPLMTLLADRFRLVSVDLRGHGRSSKPAVGYGAADFVSDIRGLIEFFGTGRAMLIGHALGARNALAAGARFPELVSAVIAIEFTPFIEPAVFDAMEARVNAGARQFEDMADIRHALARRYPSLPAHAIERRAVFGFAQAEGGVRPHADPSAMRQTSAGMREDLAPVLTDIRVPALLVRGADSGFVSAAAWAKTRRLRSDLATVEIEGADHYVSEEAFAILARKIVEFWGRACKR
jgi:2-(acetamidomethylene)succinate hydrolase